MDLNAPLGTKPPNSGGRRLGAAVAVCILALVAGAVSAKLWTADPRGGEPYAVAVIPPAAPPKADPPPVTDATPTGSIQTKDSDTVRFEHGVKVVSPAVPSAAARNTGPAVIDVSHALDEAARRSIKAKPTDADPRPDEPRAAEQAALETRPPPASAAAGAGAAGAGAAGAGAAGAGVRRPRIAIFVSGMGLDPNATRTATEIMPAAVDLAFLAGGSDPSQAVEAARAKGHEILLQLPMQTVASAPGSPHQLRRDESPAEMAADLRWMFGRFHGYAGVTNLLGAPVMSHKDAMETVLRAVGERGLFFVDDGTSKGSVIATAAPLVGTTAIRADVVLDATADASMVRANLARLVSIARDRGFAVGMASGLPDHLTTIAEFAKDAQAQGLDLVSIGAIVASAPRVATSR